MLESGENWAHRVFGAVSLTALGRSALPFAAALGTGLSDWHPKVRAASARALKALGGEVAAPHTMQLAALALRDTHWEVRQAAEDALRCLPCATRSEDPDEFLVGKDEKLSSAVERLLSSSCPNQDMGSSELATPSTREEVDIMQDLDCGPSQPQRWGIQLQQLTDFKNEILNEKSSENLECYCKAHKFTFIRGSCVHVCLSSPCPYGDHRGVPHVPVEGVPPQEHLQTMLPNMHAVVARELKPRTKPYGCSYALLTNPEGLEITSFVTHTWEEPFRHFVGTLEMALRPDDVVWVCSFALDQNADIKKLLDSDDLLRSPFAKALRHAPKLVVTLDEQLKVPERSWCAFELEKASQWGIPTFMWPYHLTRLQDLEDRVDQLDIRRASATDKTDQERIHQAIQEGIGYDAMNQRLRAFLGDRLRFYQAAVCKHVDMFAKLSRDMEQARKEKDDARVAALEAERLGQSRLLQLEMERKAWQDAHVAALEGELGEEDEDEDEEDEHRPQMQPQLESELERANLGRSEAEEALVEVQAKMQDLVCQLQQARKERDEAIGERQARKERDEAIGERRTCGGEASAPRVQITASAPRVVFRTRTAVTLWPTQPPPPPQQGQQQQQHPQQPQQPQQQQPPPPLPAWAASPWPAASSAAPRASAAASAAPLAAPVARGAHVVGIQHAWQKTGQAYHLDSVVTVAPF